MAEKTSPTEWSNVLDVHVLYGLATHPPDTIITALLIAAEQATSFEDYYRFCLPYRRPEPGESGS